MSGIAQIHQATLTPSKLELLAPWLPKQSWFSGSSDGLERIASYRFVDPDGEVGIETLIVRTEDGVFQVPLTYRGEPLDDDFANLVGTLDHSVLGTRWVYDATTDPVYVAELIRVIRDGDSEADLSQGEKSMTVEGTGTALVANAATQTVRICRRLDGDAKTDTKRAIGLLIGHWTLDGELQESVLAVLR